MTEIKKTVKFEIETSLSLFKKTNTWLTVVAIVSLISTVFRQYLIAIIGLMIIIVLKFKLDYESGQVIDYYRRQANIPNATRIRQMKEAAKKKDL